MKPNILHRTQWLVAAALIGVFAGNASAADDTAEVVRQLREQIDALDQKVKILERKREIDQDTATEKAKTTPLVSLGQNGFVFTSGDTNFSIKLGGVAQVDSRAFFKDGGTAGNDGFILRRLRPIISGTVYHDFDFLFVPDFGGGTAAGLATPAVQDAYLNYRYSPGLQIRLGKFKSPIGLEMLQADQDTFFNERGLPTGLVPNRDVGVQLWGEVLGGRLTYQAALLNGLGDNRNTFNMDVEDTKALAGRLFAQPFKLSETTWLQGLGVGVGGSYESEHSANTQVLPNYVTDGQQALFSYTGGTGGAVSADGTHWRLAPQAYYYQGPFGLLAEYTISDQAVRAASGARAKIQNNAWQVAASWVLTGENVNYRGAVVPRAAFDPASGHWGALQVLARYEALDIDNAAFPVFASAATVPSGAHAASLGLNWFLNKNVTIKTSFSRTTFSGGPAGAVSKQPENVWFTRVQLAF